MLHTEATLPLSGNIVLVSSHNDEIFLMNDDYTLFRYDANYQLFTKQKVFKNQEPAHTFSHAFSISPTHKTLLLPFEQAPVALLISIDEKLALKTKIHYPLKTVEATSFSPQNSYFAIGDAAGRVNIFDSQSAHFITALMPRPDYINFLRFSPNERYLVSCAFDKSIIVFDITLNIEIATFLTSDVVECVVFFNEGNSIAFLQRNGAIVVYHIDERKLDKEKNIFTSWPTSAVLYHDKEHLIVGMKNGHITAINLIELTTIFSEKVSFQGVTQLLLVDDRLIVAGKLMEPRIIDTNYMFTEFTQAFTDKDKESVSKTLSKNSFLMLLKSYDLDMLDFYAPIFERLYTLLEEGEIEKAQALVDTHADDPKIATYFTQISNGQEHIKQLALHIKNKSYPNAFTLIEKYSYLRSSMAGMKLENLWHKSFNQAKILSAKKDVTAMKEAQALLEPFSRVPSKQLLVHNLLKNVTIFIKADQLIQKRLIKEYFDLVDANSYLKEHSMYKKVLSMGETYLLQLKQVILVNDFSKAKEILTFLLPFTHLHTQVKALKDQLVIRMNFFEALSKKEYAKVFDLAKQYPLLRQLKEYEQIESTFKSLMKEVLDHAFNADIESIQKTFRPFEDVELFHDKIASMYKIGYLNEMKKASKDDTILWKEVFERYIMLFGKDDEIVHTAEQINKSDILLSVTSEGDKMGYHKYELPLSILKAS